MNQTPVKGVLVNSEMRHLTAAHSPTAFASLTTEDEELIAPFVRLLGLVDIGEMLLDIRTGGRSAFRHRDVTALGTRTLHTILHDRLNLFQAAPR